MCETTDGDQTDGYVERERRGDWSHLYGPECCSVCGQHPFEGGYLNVSLESRWEKKRREEREREREGKTARLDSEDHLKDLREEMAEMSLRVERLERAVLWEGSGYSSGSSGNEWAWWNGAWWIKTKSRMNSASKRKVSRAVKQAMNRDDEKLKADLSRMMVYLKNEMKSENMSDTDREMTRRRKSTEQASNASANVHRMCVCLRGWTFWTYTRSRFLARCTRLRMFPARCVRISYPKLLLMHKFDVRLAGFLTV